MASGTIYNEFPIWHADTLFAPSTATEMIAGETEIQLSQSMGNFSLVYIQCYINSASSDRRCIIILPPSMIGITPWYPVATGTISGSVRLAVGQTNGSNDVSKLKVLDYSGITKIYIFRVYGVR